MFKPGDEVEFTEDYVTYRKGSRGTVTRITNALFGDIAWLLMEDGTTTDAYVTRLRLVDDSKKVAIIEKPDLAQLANLQEYDLFRIDDLWRQVDHLTDGDIVDTQGTFWDVDRWDINAIIYMSPRQEALKFGSVTVRKKDGEAIFTTPTKQFALDKQQQQKLKDFLC